MTERCEISIESLVIELGVPEDRVSVYLNALYKGFGREGDPIQRAIDYLTFKIEVRKSNMHTDNLGLDKGENIW